MNTPGPARSFRATIRLLLRLIIVGAWFGGAPARAGTFVEFPDLPGREPAHLTGYLARPDAGLSALITMGDEVTVAPWPAVVILHGCGGISSHSAAIADRLGAWGYVALAVDSLGPRDRTGGCGSGLYLDQAFDAYAALRFLSTLAFVDAGRVALIGQSMGGSAVLAAVERDLAARFADQRFRAAIAFYPSCYVVAPSVMAAPLLILIGDADEWNSADACETLKKRARPESAPIDLAVYPGVHHAFDVAQLKPGRRVSGKWLEYDEAAARDAEIRARAFLADRLAPMLPSRSQQP